MRRAGQRLRRSGTRAGRLVHAAAGGVGARGRRRSHLVGRRGGYGSARRPSVSSGEMGRAAHRTAPRQTRADRSWPRPQARRGPSLSTGGEGAPAVQP
eukprot:scaffold12045_cov109-Isochrysis_galbana.AAC.5